MKDWRVGTGGGNAAADLLSREFGIKRVSALRALAGADENGTYEGRRYHTQPLLGDYVFLISAKGLED